MKLTCPNCGCTSVIEKQGLDTHATDHECDECGESGPLMYFEDADDAEDAVASTAAEDTAPEQLAEYMQGRFGSPK